jgi:cysteine desulfurase
VAGRKFSGVAQASASVFLDSSSGEPLLADARHAWLEAQGSGWGDPLRLHRPGRLASQALDQAREVVAQTVGARPDEVVFTASGVHSANAAVAGMALGRRRVGSLIVTSAIDHSAVLGAAEAYGDQVMVDVDQLGHVDLDAWSTEVRRDGVAMACLQVANHEVGTLQPYEQAAELCAQAGVPLVLDATAALGRIELGGSTGWSLLIGSAQAFGGPASVGVLVIRRGSRWRPPYPTDDYQSGRWPGPPDVPAIHAAAAALEVWRADRESVAARQRALIETLRSRIETEVSDVDVAGDPIQRVPHLLTFSVLYVDGETLTLELDKAGFAVASGSACSASSEHPSHVLAAMGALTHGNIRVGLTRGTTLEEVEQFLTVLPPIVAEIRSTLGVL